MKAIQNRKFFAAPLFAAFFVFSACAPRITVTASGADTAELAIAAGFSRAAEQTLTSIMGAIAGEADADAPLFTANDLAAVLRRTGLQNVTASASGEDIAAHGTIPRVSQSALAAAGILTMSEKSLALAFGPAQYQSLYDMTDEESQAYADLLMIPALSGETLTPAEYTDLLASMYGPSLAKELTESAFTVTIAAPDGKKSTTARLTLGELLTLPAEKRWMVKW